MTLISLLGKKLNDEEISQLLEDYKVGEIIYGFGRIR
ncbi:hypothetical protein EDF71_1501 [Comamonas sp. JUb58]|nr:hypothetical protein EDF71_1501 [Comamonas sp. JUb58]